MQQYSSGGAVFRTGAVSLRNAFNTELRKIIDDPTQYVSLIGKYGFTDREVPPRNLRHRRSLHGVMGCRHA
ncbi:hypothetical protein ACFYOG_16920 [Streptomyces sp. NPDC007818]|uniref:hypothetical protein n=1 Tax=Streptomyces sp. NPDC007818 TaxID=3364780 RepID=UPI0036CD4E39